ncbi:MAG: M28 family peptidase [Gemmatimonadetes bacterium]|nr:M28 family peptidase [Gemmatimonadota bacterium]
MRKGLNSSCLVPALALALAPGGCARREEPSVSPAPTASLTPAAIEAAAATITAGDLLRHTRVLSSDEFEGRAPGTPGEEKTVAYLTGEFRRIGLEPGNPNGTWTQDVPLVGISTQATSWLDVAGRRIELSFPDNYVAVSRRVTQDVHVEAAELVFVGYGVVAPEYGWDDYKGVDVRGKTIVMLINDPAVPDPSDPTRLDPSLFRGPAMTYYGRWTYKYEIATERGAAAALIVHETGPAGYPWQVVTGSWGRENFDIVAADRNMGRVPIEGWITRELAEKLCAAAGQDFAQLKAAAVRRDFRPVSLNGKATFHVRQSPREVRSKNVVAKLAGSPQRRDEVVVFTAHWDHLGRDSTLAGDQIYNGAKDNASGTAALLELAEAYAALPRRPDRSLLFLAVTAEEQGLLGAKYYAQNPLYPLARTLANLNIDGVNQWGRTRDIVVVGKGMSTLEDLLEQAAARQGRVVDPDPEPEKGFYYRSDHFELAKQGVPALYTDEGIDYIGRPHEWGLEKRDEYTQRDYHKPSDEVKPDWDLAGAVEDIRLFFDVGLAVAQGDAWPEWKEGSEFRARRLEMLRAGGQ